MTLQISTDAIKILRDMKNPSFQIMELANNLIVDFVETEDEAFQKCAYADLHGCKCKFYETSVRPIEIIREATKNVDVNTLKKVS